MTDRPILFSAPMVRALLSDRKTQTRRIIKPQPRFSNVWQDGPGGSWFSSGHGEAGDDLIHLRFAVGERLWVRENHCILLASYDVETEAVYRVDDPDFPGKWRPSIHMPRWASRLTLSVSEVRVQRLQDISEEDARAEGITDGGCLNCGDHEPCGCDRPQPDARDAFAHLWGQINGPDAWEANPWIVALTFSVERRNIDAPAPAMEMAHG